MRASFCHIISLLCIQQRWSLVYPTKRFHYWHRSFTGGKSVCSVSRWIDRCSTGARKFLFFIAFLYSDKPSTMSKWLRVAKLAKNEKQSTDKRFDVKTSVKYCWRSFKSFCLLSKPKYRIWNYRWTSGKKPTSLWSLAEIWRQWCECRIISYLLIDNKAKSESPIRFNYTLDSLCQGRLIMLTGNFSE